MELGSELPSCPNGPWWEPFLGDADSSPASEPKGQPAQHSLVLQRRVRSLLLEALRAWRIGRFDCCAIEEALQCIQRKIDKFEEKVSEIRAAAAGKVWLSIKELVDELLHHGASPGASHTDSKHCADTSLRRSNERQSGVCGVMWDRDNRRWRVFWQDAETGKRRESSVAIEKFLKQGLDEEAAIEAALEEAKTRRKELALAGKLKFPKQAAQVSSARGVFFHKHSAKWEIRLKDPFSKKNIYHICSVKEDAEAKARKLTKKFGLPAEKKPRI